MTGFAFLMPLALLGAGQMTVDTAASTQSGSDQFVRTIKERACVGIFRSSDDGGDERFGVVPLPDFSALRQSQKGPFKVNTPASAELITIMCERTTPIPSPSDYWTMLSGYGFMLVSYEGADRSFRATLSRAGEGFDYQVIEGDLTKEERIEIDRMLAQFEQEAAPYRGLAPEDG